MLKTLKEFVEWLKEHDRRICLECCGHDSDDNGRG